MDASQQALNQVIQAVLPLMYNAVANKNMTPVQIQPSISVAPTIAPTTLDDVVTWLLNNDKQAIKDMFVKLEETHGGGQLQKVSMVLQGHLYHLANRGSKYKR